MDPSEVAFKSAAGPTLRFVLVLVALVAGATALPLVLEGVAARVIVLAVAAGTLVGVVLGVLLVVVLGRLFKVYVSPGGLRSYDFWGRYHRVPWATIQAIRPVELAGLRYLRLTAPPAPSPIWLPLFLDDQDTFNRLVAELAGPQHPLTRALAEAHRETG